jgi:hypothetical protein
MPLGEELHLAGRLAEGKHGPVLFANGGEWTLVTGKSIRHLIGRRINVIGWRTGFNEILCELVWGSDYSPPNSRPAQWELLIVSGLVLGAYAVALRWLVACLL